MFSVVQEREEAFGFALVVREGRVEEVLHNREEKRNIQTRIAAMARTVYTIDIGWLYIQQDRRSVQTKVGLVMTIQ